MDRITFYETQSKSAATPEALNCVLKGHQDSEKYIFPSHELFFLLCCSPAHPESQASVSTGWFCSLSLSVTFPDAFAVEQVWPSLPWFYTISKCEIPTEMMSQFQISVTLVS